MKNNCIIIIPIYKEILSDYESISLLQGLKILDKRTIKFIAPEGLDISFYKQYTSESIEFIFLEKQYFKDIKGYNRLMMSVKFYQMFLQFEYMLIYQTDCYIFKDELSKWCELGYSYVGAPWPINKEGGKIHFSYVGNGGFSLRKIKDHILALEKTQKTIQSLFSFNSNHFRSWYALFRLRKNNWWIYRNSDKNEDMFFGKNTTRSFSFFTTPTADEALDFGMELRAKEVFKYHNEKLPMGIHAWWKEDHLETWKPFIEKDGYTL